MPANTNPIFTLTPNISKASVSAADTSVDGTGANVKTAFTAGSNGAVINSLVIKSNTTTATSAAGTLRIWINNGSTAGTAANNFLYREFVLTAQTASATTATANIEFPLNLALPAGYKILVAVATVAASSGWDITAIGADY